MRKLKSVLVIFGLVLLSALALGCHYDNHYGYALTGFVPPNA